MTDQCTGNIPFRFDQGEPEVTIEFDAQPYERTTYDSPGCDVSIEITRVVRVDNGIEVGIDNPEIDPANLCRKQLEQCVWDYLERKTEETDD
jgi:hypothetical protein